MNTMTLQEARDHLARKPKRNKLRAIKVTMDGIKFDSKDEAKRYQMLKAMQAAGEIQDLQVHPKFEIIVRGVKIAVFKPDFTYKRILEAGKVLHSVIEDVKGHRAGATWAYFRLKVRLFEAVFNHVVEVYPPLVKKPVSSYVVSRSIASTFPAKGEAGRRNHTKNTAR